MSYNFKNLVNYKTALLVLLCCNIYVKSDAQTIYFPPLNNAAMWDTISPASLGWCTNRIDSLYNFLNIQNTKAFIVLKDGKIVTNGGRVLGVTAKSETLEDAISKAYEAVNKVCFDNIFYRMDIGKKGLAIVKNEI